MPGFKDFLERVLSPDHNANRTRQKSGEGATSSPVKEEHGISLFSPQITGKQVNCIEPAEEAEPENVVHITDLPLVRSDSNASSYFVDIPEPIPEGAQGSSNVGSDSDYQSPLRPSSPSEEEFEDMEDQVRVLSLPTEEEYNAAEEKLDHMKQESKERLRSLGEEAGTLDHEKIDKARATEGAELMNIPPENQAEEKVSIDEALDQDPFKFNIGSHLQQQAEDERKQLEYEEGTEEKQEKPRKKKKNKKKGNGKKPMKHALSTESIEKSTTESKKVKIDTESVPVVEELRAEKGGYEDELEENASDENGLSSEETKPVVIPFEQKEISLGRVPTPPSFKVHEASNPAQEVEKGEFSKEEGGYEDEEEGGESLSQQEEIPTAASEHRRKEKPGKVKKTSEKPLHTLDRQEHVELEDEKSTSAVDEVKEKDLKETDPAEEEHVESGSFLEHRLKDEMELVKEGAQHQMLQAEAALSSSSSKSATKSSKEKVKDVEVPPSELEHVESGSVEEHKLKNIMEEIKEEAQNQMLEAEKSIDTSHVPQEIVEECKVEVPTIQAKEQLSRTEQPKAALSSSLSKSATKSSKGKVKDVEVPPFELEHIESGSVEEHKLKNVMEDIKEEAQNQMLEAEKSIDTSKVPQENVEECKVEVPTIQAKEQLSNGGKEGEKHGGDGRIGFERVHQEIEEGHEKGIGFETIAKDAVEENEPSKSVIQEIGDKENIGTVRGKDGAVTAKGAHVGDEPVMDAREGINQISETQDIGKAVTEITEKKKESESSKNVEQDISKTNGDASKGETTVAGKDETKEVGTSIDSPAEKGGPTTHESSVNICNKEGIKDVSEDLKNQVEEKDVEEETMTDKTEEENVLEPSKHAEQELAIVEGDTSKGETTIAEEEGTAASEPAVHIAESEEIIRDVCEGLKKLSEEMELIASEAPIEDTEDIDEKEVAVQLIDENPDLNPVEVMNAFKTLGEFAETCVSEALSDMKKEAPSQSTEQRRQRADTVESYGFTYEDEFGTDSGEEQTVESVVEVPEARELAASESGERLRKWSTGVEPHILEDLPEANQPRRVEERERFTASKGELEVEEEPHKLTRVGLTRTEVHPKILTEIHSEFVDKVLEVPLIDTGLSYAYLFYTSLKGTCPDIVQQLVFGTTERTAWVALRLSKWLLKPVSHQLHTLDHFAANCLEIVENKLLPQAS